MKNVILLLSILALTLTSCRKDFDTVINKGNLEFSKKTVYLDTVFTGIASSTYMLKVYNRSNEDISIPSIALGKGDNSKYRLMVDGLRGEGGKGKVFKNVELLANDSLFVFIEETADIADANPTDMLYTDEIQFSSTTGTQKVNLVTLIQDAIFLFPDRTPLSGGGYSYENLELVDGDPKSRIYGFELTGSELHFTNNKPYVIYGYAGVKSGDVLTIDPGARIHFHKESGIFVKDGGSILAIGDYSTTDKLEKEIIFEGDRLEPGYADVAGQWGILYLANGSTNNVFNHVTVKNGTVGIFVDRQDATTTQIKNTQIYNCSDYGIVARNGKINGDNIVVNKCGQASLACILGGTYDFLHCTFANFWTGSNRQTPTVYLDNTYKEGNTLFTSDLLQANFTNCIIYGSNNLEVGINKVNTTGLTFTTNFTNCLIRFNDYNNQYTSNPLYTAFLNNGNNLISKNGSPNDPKFKNASKNQMNILVGSAAITNGSPLLSQLKDINGNDRPLSPTKPDIGAYKYIP